MGPYLGLPWGGAKAIHTAPSPGPARLRVIRICRPRYGCQACGTIQQAPAPERPIAKDLAPPALPAHVMVSKYCDTCRSTGKARSLPGRAVEIDRSTLANWFGGACWWLAPPQKRLSEDVFASQKLFADDTPIPVLDPGRGRTKTGRLWVYARGPTLERTRSVGHCVERLSVRSGSGYRWIDPRRSAVMTSLLLPVRQWFQARYRPRAASTGERP